MHSHYRRHVTDLPRSGRIVPLVVIARRLRDAVLCGRQIFTEPFADDALAPRTGAEKVDLLQARLIGRISGAAPKLRRSQYCRPNTGGRTVVAGRTGRANLPALRWQAPCSMRARR